MAVTGAPLPWVNRDSRRGLYYTRTWRGIRVVSMWPRRRKARRTAKQRQKETDFAAVSLAIKWLDPEILSTTIDAAKGSPVLWRDMLTAQFYGTAFLLDIEGGKTIYPRQFLEKVSGSLDTIGSETGALLVRQIGQWQTVTPAEAGTVWTSTGENTMPQWKPL